MNQAYLDAVKLLLTVAPVIFRKPTFALKGGTASMLPMEPMTDLIPTSTVARTTLRGQLEALRLQWGHGIAQDRT